MPKPTTRSEPSHQQQKHERKDSGNSLASKKPYSKTNVSSKNFEKFNSRLEERGVSAFMSSSSRNSFNHSLRNNNKRNHTVETKSTHSTSKALPTTADATPAPSVLDIQSEYFQKEFNPKNLPLHEITQLSLANRGFEDVKNLHLCENLKRLEVHKNKLKNLKFVMQNFKIQHLDAHENQIVSSNETNSEILSLVQNAPNLKVLNLSHNQLANKLILNSTLLRTAQPEKSTEEEPKKKILKTKSQSSSSTTSSSTSSLLALILNDNNLQELQLEGKFEHLNTIIISRNPKLTKFVDFANVPSLTKFGATETALVNLDQTIVTCKQTLQELRLSHNPQLFSNTNCISTLKQIEQLESLKLLAISHNKISHQWNTVKNHLVKIIKNNPNLRNLSIVGNFDEHIQNVGAEKFKEEIIELFSNAGISLTHLDDKPVPGATTEKAIKKGETAREQLHKAKSTSRYLPEKSQQGEKSEEKRKTKVSEMHESVKASTTDSKKRSNEKNPFAKKSMELPEEDEPQASHRPLLPHSMIINLSTFQRHARKTAKRT
ncbi:hypothetical protein C9374_004771 [Naegleria lovaniensis]|uniref:Uncharacterized protein n=1 Tax=Naegleria lovaniensis TaxID=51637 RepID=A0AA88KIG8_NAELO|nr:uncharacterized protein C9374_004771 [Naegleria lovaniensis]KAG2382804.1 hypothetical protein C9374_004771 [Naegleria lovaniensis]